MSKPCVLLTAPSGRVLTGCDIGIVATSPGEMCRLVATFSDAEIADCVATAALQAVWTIDGSSFRSAAFITECLQLYRDGSYRATFELTGPIEPVAEETP